MEHRPTRTEREMIRRAVFVGDMDMWIGFNEDGTAFVQVHNGLYIEAASVGEALRVFAEILEES